MRKNKTLLSIFIFIISRFTGLLSAQNVHDEESISQLESNFKNSEEHEDFANSQILFLPDKPAYSFYGREYVLNIIKTQDEELNESNRNVQENPEMTSLDWDLNQIHIKLLVGPSGIGKTATLWQFIEKYGENYHNIIWFDGSSLDSLFKSIRNLVEKIQSETSTQSKSQSQSQMENENIFKGEDNEFLEIQLMVEDVYKKLCRKKSLIIFDNVNIPMEKLVHFLPVHDQPESKYDEIPLIVMTTLMDFETLLSVKPPPLRAGSSKEQNENQEDTSENENQDDTSENENEYEVEDGKVLRKVDYTIRYLFWKSPYQGFPQINFYVLPINPFEIEETFALFFKEYFPYNKNPGVDYKTEFIKGVQELHELLGGFPLAMQQAASYLNEENDLIRAQQNSGSVSSPNNLKLLTIQDYIDLIHAHSNSRPYLHDHPLWTTTSIVLRMFRERAVHNPMYKLSVQILEAVAIIHPLPVHSAILGHALTFRDENRPTLLPRLLPKDVPSYAQDSFNILATYAVVESPGALETNANWNWNSDSPSLIPRILIRWDGPARLSSILNGKNSEEMSSLFYFILEPLDEICTSTISPLERVKTFREENRDLHFQFNEHYMAAMEAIMSKIWLTRETSSYPHFLKYILKFSAYFCHLGKFQNAETWIFHFFSLLKTVVDDGEGKDNNKQFNTNILESLFQFDGYKLPDKKKSLKFHRLVSKGAHHVFDGSGYGHYQVLALTLENLAQAQTEAGDDADDDYASQSISLYRQAYQMTKSGATLNKMANALLDQKKYKEAKRIFFDEIYEHEASVYGEGHPKALLPLHSLAKTYSARGDYQTALEILLEIQNALVKYQDASASTESPSEELELFSLSILHSVADAHFKSGQAYFALKMYEKVHSSRQKILGAKHPDTLAVATDLVQCYRALERNPEANKLSLEIGAIKSEDLGLGLVDSHASYLDIGDVLFKEGKWKLASNAYHIIHTSGTLRLGDNHMETLEAYEKVGMAELGAEEWDQSIEILQNVLDSRKSQTSIANTNPFSLISPLPALSYANFLQGKNTKGMELMTEFQNKIKEIHKNPKNDSFVPLLTVALHHARKGRQKQVLKALSPLYDIQKEIYGRNHPQTINSLRHFALIYLSQKNYIKALQLAKLCVKLARGQSQEQAGHTQIQIRGKNHQPSLNPQLIPSLEALALVYEAQKDFDLSLEIYFEVSKLQEETGQNQDLVLLMEKVAAALYDQQNYAPATQYYEKIYNMRNEVNGATHSLTIKAQMRRVSSLVQAYPNQEGLLSFKSLHEIWKEMLQEEHSITIESLGVIAKIEMMLEKWEEAIKSYEKLQKIQSKISGEGSEDALQCIINMALIYEKQEKFQQALDLVKKVIEIQNKDKNKRDSNNQKIMEAQEFKKRLERTIKIRKRVQQAMKDEL